MVNLFFLKEDPLKKELEGKEVVVFTINNIRYEGKVVAVGPNYIILVDRLLGKVVLPLYNIIDIRIAE